MPPTLKITLSTPEGPLVVTVRELTVAEIRAWVNESAAAEWRDPVHATAFEDVGLDEIARMVDVPIATLERFTPSELAPVVEAAKGLNAGFFRLQSAVQWATRRLRPDAPPEASTAASVA